MLDIDQQVPTQSVRNDAKIFFPQNLCPLLRFKYSLSNPKIRFQTQPRGLVLRHICPTPLPRTFGTFRAMSPTSRNTCDKPQAFLGIFCQKLDVSEWLYREISIILGTGFDQMIFFGRLESRSQNFLDSHSHRNLMRWIFTILNRK